MKHAILALLLVGLTLGAVALAAEADVKTNYLAGVEHFKQSTVRLQGGKVIYVDPYRFDGEPHDADLVLITHTHGDHFAAAEIKKVMKPGATVAVTADGLAKLPKDEFPKVITVAPNQGYEAEGITFRTVPAYNIGKEFHPKDKGWVGYIVDFNKLRYYFAGDTDVIPEMKDIRADVAFLPVGGKYTMTAAEAAQAANLIQPKVAVPYHFLDVVGTMDDARQFVSLLDPSISGIILRK
jgi:L-ascorbate metabolism protein UlaG (beta-lactamase superfamily)